MKTTVELRRMEDGSGRFYALKEQLFARAKEDGLVTAGASKPADYIEFMRDHISEGALRCYQVDVDASKGERLVWTVLPETHAAILDYRYAEGLARKVLGLEE